jgi:DNA-binding NtrC family response regulator
VRESRFGRTTDRVERSAGASAGGSPFRYTGGEPPLLRPHVLLVDDDETFVQTCGALLRLHGYNVTAELTLEAALRYLSAQTPDVLITDLRLADGEGWVLAEYASVHQPRLPVVVVTGTAYVMETEACYGRIPVFLKPFDPDALFRYLESLFLDGAAVHK